MLKRLLLLIVVLVAAGCDDWVEKLAPSETAFARHCFSLLQRRDFVAIENLAAPSLRTDDFPAHLADMAALIPQGDPISSHATSVNTSTTNGYTVATVSMEYQFPSGWLKFDIGVEGSGKVLPLTWISLGPTDAPVPMGFLPFFAAIPITGIAITLIGTVIYRRRLEKREKLQTTPAMRERRGTWSATLDAFGARTPWLYRLIGIRHIDLISTLGLEECRRRLRDSIESNFTLFRWGKAPRSDFQGSVGQSRFRISRQRSFVFHSHYQTFLYGSLEPDAAGTRVHCRLGPQKVVLALIAVFLVFVWTIFPVVSISQRGFQAGSLIFLIGPLLMTGGMAAGFAMNRGRLREDGPYLLDFLSQTLDAAPAAASGAIEPTVRR